jgi:flagellar biosynthesis protein FlhF
MSKLTVKAMDTATAMDEIVNKLGPDAVILSTSKIDGKIVMEAASGTQPTQGRLMNEKQFSNILSEKMIDTPGKNKTNPGLEKMLPTAKEFQNLQSQMSQIQKMLSGLFITDLDGVNQDLSSNSRVILQQAGFSSQVLNDFKTAYLGKTFRNGCDQFLSDISSHLTYYDSESLLSKKFIFITGQSGTGRTTMVGKLTASLKEALPNKSVITAEMITSGQQRSSRLQDFCRLLNSQVYTIGVDTSASDFNEIKSNEVMIVDMAMPVSNATEKLTEILPSVGPENVGIILTVPASTSAKMIEITLNDTKLLEPIVALTKLDECEVTTAEFSSFATINAKIGLFSASKSIADAPLFASESVLMQYLKENLDFETKISPLSHRSEA